MLLSHRQSVLRLLLEPRSERLPLGWLACCFQVRLRQMTLPKIPAKPMFSTSRARRARPLSWQAARLMWAQPADSHGLPPRPILQLRWRSLSLPFRRLLAGFSLSLCKTCKRLSRGRQLGRLTTNLEVESRGRHRLRFRFRVLSGYLSRTDSRKHSTCLRL